MFRSYLKAAWRNTVRQKGYALINITGLAVGIASCLFISIWIANELSYDKFHADVDRIYGIMLPNGDSSGPNAMGPAIEEVIPEIQHATRVDWLDQSLVTGIADTSYEWIMAVDPTFFEVFSFPFTHGDPSSALADVNSIVIDENVAERFFPDRNAVGQVLTLNGKDEFTVTGVIDNVPSNSSLRFDIVVPFENKVQQHRSRGEDYVSWGWWSASTYIKTHTPDIGDVLSRKISDMYFQHRGETREFIATPLAEVRHTNSNITKSLYIFGVVAVIILTMACINFINFSIARSSHRARETGIRKVSGASRGVLIGQFIIEYLLQSLGALGIALILVEVFLPLFNDMTGMSLSRDLLFSNFIILVVAGLPLIIGIAAGAYPAFYLSAFRPVAVLKGCLGSGTSGARLRRLLTVAQLAASVFLIIATATVYSQLEYMKSKDIGYNKEHVINIALRGDSRRQYQALKSSLLQDARILSVTGSAAGLPYWRWTTQAITWLGKDPTFEAQVAMNMVDYDFANTFGIEIVGGRDFSSDFATDSASAYVINQSMAELMGTEDPVGAELTVWDNPGVIVGIMKDFHFRPLDEFIRPLTVLLRPDNMGTMSIRIQPGDISSTLAYIGDVWSRHCPEFPFSYSFLDEQFARSYRQTERMGTLAAGFSMLAIFIACLGLLGLASFAAEQRTKEVGIRKVLGASAASVIGLLTREFAILVLIANVIVWPVAWLVSKNWLESFAYHINPNWSVFVLTGCTTLLIAVLVVSTQTIRAAVANPADSLKYE